METEAHTVKKNCCREFEEGWEEDKDDVRIRQPELKILLMVTITIAIMVMTMG